MATACSSLRSCTSFETLQARIFNLRARSFDELPWVRNTQLLEGMCRPVFAFVQSRGASKFLDVGTGTGEVLGYLTENLRRNQPFFEVRGIGIDISEEMLEVARRKPHIFPNARLEIASIYEQTFEQGFFDFATCRNTLHHLSDPSEALWRMGRLVKKGGYVWVAQGAAPDVYTLERWREVLLCKNAIANHRVLLSVESAEKVFSRVLGWKADNLIELLPVPLSLKAWLANASIDDSRRADILRKVKQLYKDDRFRESFGLVQVPSEVGGQSDFIFPRRSILVRLKV